MNNGSLHMKSSSRTTSITDQSLKQTPKQDTSLDLPDVSIISVGLTRYQQYNHRMLTDDEEDIEVDETSDEDDDDEDDDLPSSFISHSHLSLNPNHDNIDIGPIDPDTQAKLAAILEATGITNSPIPEDFWRDQQVVRLLTSSVTNNLNGLHEIANVLSSSSTSAAAAASAAAPTAANQTDKKSKLLNKDSGVLLRACVNNDIQTVEKILQRKNIKEYLNDINEDGDSILSLACSNGYTDLVELILRTIPDIAVNDRGNKQDCTPLMEACNAGHFDIVELLIKYHANVNIQSTSGNTALHYAAGGGYVDIVQLLLRHGAKVEETNENGHTPLMEAAGGGHVEVTQVLLDHGAGVNTSSKDKNGNDTKERKTDEMHTALMEACMDGHVQVARLLLDHGADVNMPPDSYESPLTLSACGGHFELASLLIERGANLEEVNDEGYTPLMEASREGHDDIVNLLISKGANVNRTTEEAQETALTLACAGGFMDVVKILLSNGADINLGQSTPLMEASQEGHIELVQYLIENGAHVQQKTRTEDTALGYACEGGHTEVAEVLINAGAPIDQAENEGRTPLMKASRAGHTCTVRYLISKGADVNRSTHSNDASVLSLACAGGHFEIATILLINGADPNHLLKDRSNCLIEAAKGGHTAIVQLLLEYPKSILTCTNHSLESQSVGHEAGQNEGENGDEDEDDDNDDDDEEEEEEDEDEDEDDDENSAAIMPNSFPLPSPPLNSSSFTHLENSDKLMPRKFLELLKNVKADSNELHSEIDAEDTPNCLLSDIDRIIASANDETPIEHSKQAIQLHLLEQLQHVGKEMHDSAQNHLTLNQEYRQQVTEHIQSNLSSHLPSNSKKKRTTSSSTTSSSSSVTSSSSSTTDKPDESNSPLSTYAIPSQTINFFSSPTMDSNPCSSSPSSSSHHHSKMKKSLHRQISKSDRRLEQHIHENQNHLKEINQHFKNLQLLSSATDATTTKTPMRINTDTQKALEHLRQLVNNPSALERMQTLKNNPNLIKEIQKIASQKPSMDQLRSLKSANLPQRNTIVEKKSQELANPLIDYDATTQSLISSDQVRTQSTDNTDASSTTSHARTGTCCVDHPTPVTPLSHLRFQNRIDVDSQTESNHDTALTLACAGGHEELVILLLQRNANIEHRDKKGFTPLILAATAGHASIVSRLIISEANIEAQSERTKDTALSLACSGGRQEVVEVLLKHGANREHRNVSDYTALSLAASGGYVNIIKLLLSHGAEINSRTGSKLGITPLMLASMNGHVAAVKLLLDMGSDINAQIETNRNTALTLACFQGRAEIVSLLVERKANIEHRAKTGLTPLMESASGGYVDVGRVLLERGADVNATPVPTSKDTALTIAADKGHHKFVELLLHHNASIDVRNKKGATPLWLACNGGHLEVVQSLITRRADPDSSDSRKVSCLMAAFRKGHIKVVKYLVRQVRQFPSDADCRRLISTITDKDLLKRCQTCMDQIITAKERQAAEANKAANSLLKEIDLEKSREQTRKVAAAKKREKRKAKKKGKQQTTTDEPTSQVDEQPEVEESAELSETIAPPPSPPPPAPTPAPAPPVLENLVVEHDPRLQMVKGEDEPKPLSPEPATKQSSSTNKKKTYAMTRKIERHQENLASKSKQQQQQQEPASTAANASTTDDGWQEVIGKQKKITIPHEQYSRIIGRSGSNLNVLREVTGASIDVENKRAIGDKTILIKGNGDSIKHAYQLIMALLNNSESELMNLLPSSNKIKSLATAVNYEYEDELMKNQRKNTGPRLQTNESSYVEVPSLSRNNPRSTNQAARKNPSTISTRSISSSAPIKHPQPLTSTGATWVNSNRSNRAISSSSSSTSNATTTTINPMTWTYGKPSLGSLNKAASATHQPYANYQRLYSNNSHPSSASDVTGSTGVHHMMPSLLSQPVGPTSYRLPNVSSLLVAAPSSTMTAGEYNPFASNLLTTSIVDVLTKNKEGSSGPSTSHDESSTKMNFANVAKMNVPVKSAHGEPMTSSMNESTSPPLLSDPKIAPGYRGPPSTTPVQQLAPPTTFDSLSPTSQMNRAPGANRTHASISPSMTKTHLEQNGQTGSSTGSSTSSSPSSFKQPTNYFHPSQPLFPPLDQQKPLGAIGSHRPLIPHDENPLQMPSKYPSSNHPLYHQPPPPLLLSASSYNNNAGRNRSNLNPSAPEFPHPAPISNGPLSSNIINIARIMEQQHQQQQHQQQQQQQLYSNVPVAPSRSSQQTDMEAMQHVQNQALHLYHLHSNQQQQQQQQQQQHLVQSLPPPPPLLTTLQIAKILASKGQLPADPNQAAALVAAYHNNLFPRTPQANNIPLSSNVNTTVYETINTPTSKSNGDDLSLPSVDPINGQVPTQVLVDPAGIMSNSNHSTGPLLSSSSTSTTGGDQKMVPAAIGSERKRHMPPSVHSSTGDRSSMSKQPYPYSQQQPPPPQTRDYPR